MAMITLDGDSIERAIADQGYVSMNEPTCGAGGMVIATAHALSSLGYSPSQHLRVTAQDIDYACCQMTYLNCVFFGIPAAIIHGDVLALEERSIMKTPALLRVERLQQSKAA
jgi:type I restriction-modification system DNA methylase subunit